MSTLMMVCHLAVFDVRQSCRDSHIVPACMYGVEHVSSYQVDQSPQASEAVPGKSKKSPKETMQIPAATESLCNCLPQ